MRSTRRRRITTSLATIAVSATAASLLAAPAAAAPATASQATASSATASSPVTAASDEFYTPPSPLPEGESGDVIRHEETAFFLDPLKLARAPADAQRVMYRSTDTHGDANAVTGTVLTPHRDWNGPGERPVVGYSAGTQGMGDRCAPSKAMAAGMEYEGAFIAGLLAKGYAVAITDYEGLGTPGVHTYVNRKATAHAALDVVRAAQQLPEAGLPSDGPVLTAGYSQGGGASAAAAELQPSYAPDVDLIGSFAGAPPSDLSAVADRLDGHYASAFLLFAVASMHEAYPDLGIEDILNEKGHEVRTKIEERCTADGLVGHAFTRTSELTVDGRPIGDYLAEEPFRSAVEEQRIGTLKPEAPVYVAHSRLDDIVPYDQGRDMARSWCEQDATVQFDTLAIPTHVGGYVGAYPKAYAWFDQRVRGETAPTNCGGF
ncbi:lipase family protein [Prauserella halophila]|uniref:Lipase family protein n=1 Tax=Prauserella halophila TaxID=185641 RepID=A0ABN1WBN2_9PSEU|nr:lipase family protein [Prauserella halophila]MCP2236885.1 Secretory lipase [Prauserella halophila]